MMIKAFVLFMIFNAGLAVGNPICNQLVNQITTRYQNAFNDLTQTSIQDFLEEMQRLQALLPTGIKLSSILRQEAMRQLAEKTEYTPLSSAAIEQLFPFMRTWVKKIADGLWEVTPTHHHFFSKFNRFAYYFERHQGTLLIHHPQYFNAGGFHRTFECSLSSELCLQDKVTSVLYHELIHFKNFLLSFKGKKTAFPYRVSSIAPLTSIPNLEIYQHFFCAEEIEVYFLQFHKYLKRAKGILTVQQFEQLKAKKLFFFGMLMQHYNAITHHMLETLETAYFEPTHHGLFMTLTWQNWDKLYHFDLPLNTLEELNLTKIEPSLRGRGQKVRDIIRKVITEDRQKAAFYHQQLSEL